MSPKLIQTIKKAACTTAIFIKRIPNINFKSKQEIIEAYEIGQESDWIDFRNRNKRFHYYRNVFGLEEAFFLDELTDKEAEQYSLIWKLVDLEEGST